MGELVEKPQAFELGRGREELGKGRSSGIKWSLTIATIAGTRVRIHITFFVLLVWIGAEFWSEGGAVAAVGGLAFFLSLFFCVLLHEFGHVAAARFFGVRTPSITLLPIGGVAQLERIPKNPVSELVIALAGPMVNVLIVATLWAVTRVAPSFDLDLHLSPTEPVLLLASIMWINVMLAVFNMVPAFPMDGGRVLRALLAFKMPWQRATRCAATTGQALAFGGAGIGLVMHNPFLLLIAVFIFFAAGGEAAMAETEGMLEGVTVASAGMSQFESLSPDSKIADAVALLLDGSQHEFPVVDDSGACVGILTRHHMIRALAEQGPDAYVANSMATQFPRFKLGSPLIDAFKTMSELRIAAAPVVGEGGGLSKWLTTDNIAEVLMARTALSKR